MAPRLVFLKKGSTRHITIVIRPHRTVMDGTVGSLLCEVVQLIQRLHIPILGAIAAHLKLEDLHLELCQLDRQPLAQAIRRKGVPHGRKQLIALHDPRPAAIAGT
jgi:hypothetical protein